MRKNRYFIPVSGQSFRDCGDYAVLKCKSTAVLLNKSTGIVYVSDLKVKEVNRLVKKGLWIEIPAQELVLKI